MLISDSKNSANDELSATEDRDIKPTDIELKVTVTSTLIAKNFQNDFKYAIVLDLLWVLSGISVHLYVYTHTHIYIYIYIYL